MNAISQINKIYGDTESMEGTYKHFLDIKHEAEYLEKENKKLKKAIEILKDFITIDKFNNETDKFKNETFLINANGFDNITQKEYELLKEVLENE